MAQDEEVEDHIEDNGERAGYLVEGDLYVFEAEVVEDDHAGEDEGEGEHLLDDVRAQFEGRHTGYLEGAGDVAEEDGDDALGPSDEEGGGLDVLIA